MKKFFLYLTIILFASIFTYLSYSVSVFYSDNADSQWIPVIFNNLESGSQISVPSHTSMTKWPLAYALGFTNLSLITQYHIINLSSMVGMLLLIYYVVIKLFNFRPKYFQALYISVISIFLFSNIELLLQSGMPSLRNIEFGILLLILYSYFDIKLKNNARNFLIIFCPLILLLYLTDALNILYITLPILIYELIYFYKYSIPKYKAILVITLLFTGVFSMYLIKSGFNDIFSFLNIVPNDIIIFASVENFGTNLSNTGYVILKFIGMDFWEKGLGILSGIQFILSIINLLVIIGIIKFVWDNLLAKNELRKIEKFLLVLNLGLISNILIYLFTTFSSESGTSRYLIYLPYIVSINLIYYIDKSIYNSRNILNVLFSNVVKRYTLLICCVVLAFFMSYNTSNNLRSNIKIDKEFYNKLEEISDKHSLRYGAAGYWNTFNIMSLLNNKVTIAAIVRNCEDFKFTTSDSFYKDNYDFLILDRFGSDKPFLSSCPDDLLRKKFGDPIEIITITKDSNPVNIWLYK